MRSSSEQIITHLYSSPALATIIWNGEGTMTTQKTKEYTQEHPYSDRLTDGKRTLYWKIIRKDSRGGHLYQYTYPDGATTEWLPSVTSLLKHAEPDSFGIGVNWAAKLIRESGDYDAAKVASKEAIDSGNNLHESIEHYIETGSLDEESDMFMAWYEHVGKHHHWVASEVLVAYEFGNVPCGGTVDAISLDDKTNRFVIWDWKTKNSESYRGPSVKDALQLGKYSELLWWMSSRYAHLGDMIDSPFYRYMPEARIAYIMRDASDVKVVSVDVDKAATLYDQAAHLQAAMKEGKETLWQPA